MIRALVLACLMPAGVAAQIPFHQDKPPNEPYTPAQALKKMRVPKGFSVELVASEPDIVNPVAMTFDEKGRIWITESIEYPRKSAGKGEDRIKVLEDTDRDGKVDKVTVFATGLNIPSGIAVGHGGVWVVNAPHLYFMRDTDGDLKADKTEIIASGFGRDDTHELPNSLTWGPDGYLYGLNGVFNHSHVTQDLDGDGKPDNDEVISFTCAMFRIDPWSRKLSIFCQGTSNPWGIAFDENGSAFVSACVIDHLWHQVETGYYERQGGTYPPFTWRLGSIVEHQHQKAAYCGLTWFDSKAYPAKYRGVLYMGNIHGNCINSDAIERRGSSYFGKPLPDFLTVEDAWFMPVAQKTGPDGCLYVLDWYDRYHCYQDAQRDAKGVDRGKGRLYRIRYVGAEQPPAFDLAAETDEQLLARLRSPNVYYRRTAQRLLNERSRNPGFANTRTALEQLALSGKARRKSRLHALWTLVSTGRLDRDFHDAILRHKDATFRAWAVRAAGNFHRVDKSIRTRILAMATDKSPDVRLQVAIAARKISELEPVALLVDVVAHSDDDSVIPRIVWQNLHPILPENGRHFLELVRQHNLDRCKALASLLPRATERFLADADDPAAAAVLLELFELIVDADPAVARRSLGALAKMIQTGQLSPEQSAATRQRLLTRLKSVLDGSPNKPLYPEAAFLVATWNDKQGQRATRRLVADRRRPVDVRLHALDVLISIQDDGVLATARKMLTERGAPVELQIGVLGAMSRLAEDAVASVVIKAHAKLAPQSQPKAIDLLTQRAPWSRQLIAAIESKVIPATAVNGHQVHSLRTTADTATAARITALWGKVRSMRSAGRESVIARVDSMLRVRDGKPLAGEAVFAKHCAQCHRIYGKGSDIGPDLTANGRSSLDQLLSNVLDPNLVVGEAYQLRSAQTKDGRLIAGMLIEDTKSRVVIKTVGGESEIIPRSKLAELLTSPASFMPEGLEQSMSQQELVDLFAFLTLDKHPGDASATAIPGRERVQPRATTNREEFDALLHVVAPGFHVEDSDESGVALLEEHLGRYCVVRTHPIRREKPCVLEGYVTLPSNRKTDLALSVGHHAPADGDHDWRLVVKVDGKVIHRSIVGKETAKHGWVDLFVDLSQFAGKRIKIELLNEANDWSSEFGYWGRVALVDHQANR